MSSRSLVAFASITELQEGRLLLAMVGDNCNNLSVFNYKPE
jgi:hypothetical protein